jgi:hypothetical protein
MGKLVVYCGLMGKLVVYCGSMGKLVVYCGSMGKLVVYCGSIILSCYNDKRNIKTIYVGKYTMSIEQV